MTTPPVQIVGFTSTDFVPGFVGETVLGAGAISASSIPNRVLLVGNKTAAGSATPNQDSNQIFSEDDANAYYGVGSELARMMYAALRVPGVILWGAPNTESAGANATFTITITGTATSDGTHAYRINGFRVEVPVTNGDAQNTVAARVNTYLQRFTKLPATFGNATNVTTGTAKNKGLRANDLIVFQDTSKAPSGQTSALGGTGASVTGGGKKFGGGTTADDITTVAANVFPAWYQRVGLAVRDATNLGVWEINTDNKAGPLEGRPEHVTCASNDTLSNWTSAAQTTLNNGRFCALWMLNGESDPAEMAAFFAALRAVTEQGDPNTDYDGAVLTGIAPHSQTADIPQRATKVSALQNSVTPITTEDNSAKIVRAITTRSLNGSIPDYRCLDTNQAVTPDTFRITLGLRWLDYKKANPIVADDPAPEQPDRPSGVATPSRWNSEVEKCLRDFEAGRGFSSGLPQCIDVDLNKPASGYDKAAKRIMTLAPIVPAPRHHQVGVSVRQL